MIYCIEDDSSIRDLMVYTLQATGYEAMGFESDLHFWPAMNTHQNQRNLRDLDADYEKQYHTFQQKYLLET